MNDIGQLLENNKQWAAKQVAQDPRFFADLAEQQTPKYLWIGCSDSRVPANVIVDLQPGEVFVHRNVANLVIHTDMNCLSVLQFAVEVLKVEHVIVCGHYGCGGVAAATDKRRHGMIDNWLRHIQESANLHARTLESISDDQERLDKLCELNVAAQVLNVAETTIVDDAWQRGQQLSINGWIYSIRDGRIRDLNIALKSDAEMRELRIRYLSGDKLSETVAASNR